ncbi:hypothetical protein EJ05DRAFT_509904 [Pseudovirgaria hyperparasitica]|uniref:TNFR-Cys domain-containing protein n=1 Tax=Pseudovirgaria hyperparasitica TaxID=470096 RepID=A0A6A6W903_9PEZI|nr:uncharacterized protein EJ05DRAFT_509904 [Pseudovirgaria hyperparasitica]KAF2759035.1 hypothetical protein EJ05DRAFT_509904 [Pseudovirgaria hyperparasitica]
MSGPAYTYSFEDYALSSVSVMGSSPLSEGLAGPTNLPDLPCVLDASKGAASKFKLLSPAGLPIVSRDTSIGPFPSPSSQAEANALGPAEDLVLSTFYFSTPENGPGYVYDLVLSGSPPKYVGKVSDGSVVLLDSSTGLNGAEFGDQQVITSTFSVDCKGRIIVSNLNGNTFTWKITGGATTMTLDGADGSSQHMLALPVATKPSNRRHRRQSQASSGVAPRCPSTPANLFSKAKPGAGANINGCGASNGFDTAPPSEYNFQSCCNSHDSCYENCEQTTFEQCNTSFQSCMKDQACASLNSWDKYDSYLACTQLADYTYSVVSSDTGRQEFYEESNRQCACFCSNTQGLCRQTDNSYQCTDLFATDSNNCGACGRTCPAKTRCSAGSCVCAHDQCGTQCVDFQTHPSNCGSCGTVCASGYCLNGMCATPPTSPTACVPGEAFANGQFTTDFSGWTTSRAVPAPAGVVPIGRAADSAASDGYSLSFNPTAVYQTASTELRVCAGLSYEVSFQVRTENDSFGGCNIWVQVAGNRQIWRDTTRPTSNVFRSVGPLGTGSFTDKTAGVRVSGMDLYVPFMVVLQCQGQGGGSVRFDGFSAVAYSS